ncbi:hypothetical protein Patl1_12606 [Pistacia atlantica]|uniref:Uncharacterized protein n=1 Tax=Pistacia atlantica TaxID=434234 RepID=A0ACC1AVL7_9ROSI|nr:hypothetical protein Patl1_12606 [Pistacia atlantica]
MGEEMNLEAPGEAKEENESQKGRCCECFWTPIDWIKMLATEMHWTFVFGVVVVYGISQGLGGALVRVGTEYYMKDVQKVQPSESQVYSGITLIPWIVKPLWGLLTDVLPIYGYRRRPYFILAGFLGVTSMLVLSLHQNLHLVLAVLSLTAASAGIAIADVTIDACVAHNSISHPSLASDMQSLCSLCAAIGALVGYSISGIFVHLIGPKGVYGLMTIPSGLVFLVGILLNEPQVNQKFLDAGKAMWTTLKFPLVWRPCLYMYLSFALSLHIHEGLFYWYTDSKAGPAFSQLLSGLSGMLDLMLVLRLNLAFGIPDFVAIVIDEGVSRLVGQMKRMPLLVLSSRLCPRGIEGTFFALLMSIENAGFLSSSWLGGLLLHLLKVTRTQFDNLWLAIIIRNILRVTPLCILFLVPRGDPHSSFLPAEVPSAEEASEALEPENIELVALVNSVDDGR